MSEDKRNGKTADDSGASPAGTDKRQLARTQGRYSNEDSEKKFSSERTGSFSRRSNQEDRNFYPRRRRIDSIPPRRRQANYFSEKDNIEQRPRKPRMPMNENSVRYVANEYVAKFEKLEPKYEPIEIKKSGLQILSNTENGESRVYYYPSFLAAAKAYLLFDDLHEKTKWFEKEVFINGERYPQPRLVAWYGPLPYSYSGVSLAPREFSDTLLQIKYEIEQQLKEVGINEEFNSVLLNLYRDNKDSVAWHSDDELSMGICPTIASVSLGEVRRFEMRRKSSKPLPKNYAEYVAHLKHGSLIVMDGVMQLDWEHRVPKEYHDKSQRINLTFRTVYSIERLKRPIGKVNLENPIEDKAKSKAATNQEPFRYEDDNFPCLGSHKQAEKTNPKTSQRINREAVTPKETDTEFDRDRENARKRGGGIDKRGKQFKNQNIRDYSNNSFQYRSRNHNMNKNTDRFTGHRSDNIDCGNKIPSRGATRVPRDENTDDRPSHPSDNVDHSIRNSSRSTSHVPGDTPKNSESMHENGTDHSSEAYARCDDELSNSPAVQRLQEIKDRLSGTLNETQFSDRDKGEINVLLEFAREWKHLPSRLIDVLVSRLEFLMNDAGISTEN